MTQKSQTDGTISADGKKICDYHVTWVPFGRWVASCEAGYYVTFLGQFL